MNVINKIFNPLIRSVFLSAIGIAGFAILSVILTAALFSGPNPDGTLTKIFEGLVEVEEIAELGYTFADIANDMFIMIAWLNVWLLAITIIFALSWSVGSHFLNVDAPGKAKLYAIHWLVVSAAFLVLIISTNWFILDSSTFRAAQDISTSGFFSMTFYTTTFYTLGYYISVLLGTARFVRSSVLLANKLPGNI